MTDLPEYRVTVAAETMGLNGSVASAAMTPVFAAVALIGLVPLFFYMSHLKEGRG